MVHEAFIAAVTGQDDFCDDAPRLRGVGASADTANGDTMNGDTSNARDTGDLPGELKPTVAVKMCRICFDTDDDQDRFISDATVAYPGNDLHKDNLNGLGRLISPCKCKGTMKFVHLHCLNEWRKVNPTSASHFQCDQCGFKYHFERTKIAHILRNEAVVTTLTFLSFILLVFLAGFLGKLLIIFFLEQEAAAFSKISPDDLEDDLDRFLHKFMTHPKLFSLFSFDVTHFMSGAVIVGVVGSMSFVSLSFSSMRMRQFRHRDAHTAMLSIVIVIGIVRALWWVYKKVRGFAVKSLELMEKRILDVEDEV
ncbi:hypothetical protein CcCBS67573_g02250 [Chytriomyces confervae]|uniref:RING-CH-type domain-containing protein n=1 Tax=Chytriomyces confervae TaxID=246404 RepID=A0A507FJL2_9FUNG|nr:hypothetical protein HDU80_006068 [Chytriomyces hyalinus]TPX76463.1 hypothetical protein CcCBS67573_g02250 [Chytriomyces confervae]